MKSIQREDFIQYSFLSNLQISPDSKEVTYVLTKQNKKENNYHSTLSRTHLEEKTTLELTSQGKERGFVPYQDGILFSTSRSKEDEAKPFHNKTCFYYLDKSGAEAKKIFEFNLNVQEIKPVANTSLLVLVALVDLNQLDPKDFDEEVLKDNQDYIVLEELPYWGNGRGYISRKRRTLFLYDTEKESMVQITHDFFSVRSVVLSKDSKKIIYTGQTYDTVMLPYSGIYEYDLSTATTTPLYDEGQMKIQEVLEVKENTCFVTASDMKTFGSGQYNDFYFLDATTKEFTKIYEYSFSIGSVISSDNRYGGGKHSLVHEGLIYFTSLQGFRSEIYTFDGKKVSKLFDFDGSVDCFDISGNTLVFVGITKNTLQEIYSYHLTDLTLTKLTDFTTPVLKDKEILLPKYMGFTDRDNVAIDAWVIEPKDYDPAQKYPGILTVHGGPRVAFGDVFFHEMQVWAAEGYFVFFANPRGSDGKGNEFSDIRGKYGTIDFNDLMDCVDHVLELYPALDAKKIGVAGGSYGGFMTNWIIANSSRFAAAASQRSIANWLSDYGTSEIGYSFDHNETGATPWNHPEKMWAQSPIKNANTCSTPTLFIHSLEDYNCPVSQGLEMFAALKIRGIPSRVCLFKGENHELSRSGKPKHRIRRLNEITDWFNKYLK